MPPWGSTFHARLRWAREAAGLNGRELADAVSQLGGTATQSRVSEWERGTTPRAGTQALLAEALGQPVAWLRFGEGEPRRGEPPIAPAAESDPPTRAELEAVIDRLAEVEAWIREVDGGRDRNVADMQRLADEAEADDSTN